MFIYRLLVVRMAGIMLKINYSLSFNHPIEAKMVYACHDC